MTVLRPFYSHIEHHIKDKGRETPAFLARCLSRRLADSGKVYPESYGITSEMLEQFQTAYVFYRIGMAYRFGQGQTFYVH